MKLLMLWNYCNCPFRAFSLSPTFCQTNNFPVYPNWFPCSLCRPHFAQYCRFNWKQCKVEVGTPSSLSLRSRWPCIFSFKWCLCEGERTGLLADRWLRALRLFMDVQCVWWAPPSTLSGNQPQHKCVRWLFNSPGAICAPCPAVCVKAQRKVVRGHSRKRWLIKCFCCFL